jgi:hypothetical protein
LLSLSDHVVEEMSNAAIRTHEKVVGSSSIIRSLVTTLRLSALRQT